MKVFMKVQEPKLRFGFTLVELLVVIAIMGTLMSMVLPAISGVRESARKTVCLNNMKQLGIAMETYVTSTPKLAYPGFRGNQLKSMNDAPWTVMILPFYDEKAEFDAKWQIGTPTTPNLVATAYKPSLNCVSDTPPGTEIGYTSYVYNSGIGDTGVEAQKVHYHNRANGLGVNRLPPATNPQGGASSFNTKTTVEDNKATTLMFSENIQAGTYGDVDEALIGFIFNPYESTVPSPPTAPIGATSPTPVELVNGVDASWTRNNQPPQLIASIVPTSVFGTAGTYPPVPNATPAALLAARPSSYHPLTVNVGMADGSTRSINENIDYSVYKYLMTTDHKRSTPSTILGAFVDDNINDSQY